MVSLGTSHVKSDALTSDSDFPWDFTAFSAEVAARILSNAWWPPRAAHVLLADGASQSSARSFQPKPVFVGKTYR